MANFDEVITALGNGKRVRCNRWGNGSVMYADANGQLMRTPHDSAKHKGDYAWPLDLRDITGHWIIL